MAELKTKLDDASLQAHHALMDGLHMGRFYENPGIFIRSSLRLGRGIGRMSLHWIVINSPYG